MGSKRVFPMIYIRKNDLKSKNYEFVVGCSNENQKENIKMRIEKFNYFKDDLDKNEFMCKWIRGGLSMLKDEIKSSFENIY